MGLGSKGFKVAGIYGGLMARKGGFKVDEDKTALHEVGKLAVKYIKQEATKIAGRPKGLPKSAKFLNSFSYKIVGKRTIKIESSWPHVKFESYQKGKRPWRVGKPGARIPLRTASGELIFRTVPADLQIGNCKVWCHPGLSKHTFIKRALARAKKEVVAKHGPTMAGQTLRKKK
ncbi:MAG: hypothetical protein CMF52_02995 [Legionellales bacterium]|nr:hypothetical protein [Legionellales bacterium]